MRRIQGDDLSGWAERPCPVRVGEVRCFGAGAPKRTETRMSEQASGGWHAKDSGRRPIRLGGETLSFQHRNNNVGTSCMWLACEGFSSPTYQVGRRDPVPSGWEMRVRSKERSP